MQAKGQVSETPEALPPGQVASSDFPRFGLPTFAHRFPRQPDTVQFVVRGDVANTIDDAAGRLRQLPRVEQISDFHCVTTWSHQNLQWSGYRFSDFYREVVLPLAKPEPGAERVVLRGEDHYASMLPLADLLAADVLLADRLDGRSLGIEHGAPLRLVAPAHYGYKNVKHIVAIEFWRDAREYRFPKPYPRLMDHPRGRVDQEERGNIVPAWLLRSVYRLLIPRTRRVFAKAQQMHQERVASRG